METNHQNSIKDNSQDEAFFKYVFLKKEKLTSALYLVTSFIPDQEPIKWKLREKGLELLSDIGSAKHASGFYRIAVLEKADRAIEDISSLIDIACVGGFVSDMNAGILKKEYQGFQTVIHERLGVRPLETMLSTPMPENNTLPIAPSQPEESKVVPKPVVTNTEKISSHSQPISRPVFSATNPAPKVTLRHNGHDDNLLIRRSAPSSGSIKDTEITNPYNGVTASHSLSSSNSAKTSINTRQESIIKYVRGRGWTPISDIAGAVPDVSVKTVQRELAELVATGVLKKMGERRWSRYIVA